MSSFFFFKVISLCHSLLRKIPDCNDCTKIECFKCSSLNIGCGRLADCFSDAAKVYEKQAENVYDGAIEGLKAFRDLLIALQVSEN